MEAHWEGRPVELGPPQRRAVLAALLLAEGRTVTVAALRDAIWKASPPASAISAIQVHVHHLRKALGALPRERENADGPPRLVTHPGHPADQVSYALHVAEGTVDAERFRTLARRADEAGAHGGTAEALALLDAALALWRGDPLAGLRIRDFHADHVLGLRDLRLDLVKRRAAALLATGATARATAELRQLRAEHPADEQIVVLLATALRQGGAHAGALDLVKGEVERWQREYGVRPPSLLRELSGSSDNPARSDNAVRSDSNGSL
ncbi:AfsR/SARP family transcriptional regulator [Streptomyces rectiverticillatus]|uniref:AfsR/SARP family transcriptional regulator n=1 Tax=Streptomyces rectiverticillatus TaxID=173860 RepID=UPI0015C3AA5E|nr:BTAD domain-containing putative transcriptional regulator [Streptomyces rectiverticillatus]